MEQSVEIEHTSHGSTFTAVLTAASLGVFTKAAQQPETVGKEGEELVTALLAHAKGGISRVARYKDGTLNDGANGEAAVQKFNDSGVLIYAAHYKDGTLNDAAKGDAAIQRSNDSGVLIEALHYKDDVLIKGLSKQESNAHPIQKAFGHKLKVRGT